MTSVGVLDKVMAILNAFEDGTARLEPPQAAARLGITTPTAYRLMSAMAAHRLLDPDGRSYRLGTKLLQLGTRVSEGVEARVAALPHMRSLRDATDETVELQILTGHRRVPVEMVVGRRTVRTMSQIGVPLPIHLGASRVLVAWLGEAHALQLAVRSAAEYAAEYPGIPWHPDDFRASLRQVREQGWQFSPGERDPETSSVCVPVRDRAGGVVASLVVSSTATRLADEVHRRRVIDLSCASAEQISVELGHHATAQGEPAGPQTPPEPPLTTTKESDA